MKELWGQFHMSNFPFCGNQQTVMNILKFKDPKTVHVIDIFISYIDSWITFMETLPKLSAETHEVLFPWNLGNGYSLTPSGQESLINTIQIYKKTGYFSF